MLRWIGKASSCEPRFMNDVPAACLLSIIQIYAMMICRGRKEHLESGEQGGWPGQLSHLAACMILDPEAIEQWWCEGLAQQVFRLCGRAVLNAE